MARKKTAAAAGTLRITMIGSVIGCPRKQRETVRGLGLRRLHQVVERPDTPAIRGMVKKIPHLVAIVE
jgi:large subunit ribosomal protein L30